MVPMVVWGDVGGLAGGEANRADCRRVIGGRERSHDESAEGINMVK